jgi:type III pantothenate kinase
MFGYCGLGKEVIARAEDEIGCRLKVIATGGLSATIAPLIGRIDVVAPLHTLDGLRLMVPPLS